MIAINCFFYFTLKLSIFCAVFGLHADHQVMLLLTLRIVGMQRMQSVKLMVCVKGSQVFTISFLYFMPVFILSNRLSLLDNFCLQAISFWLVTFLVFSLPQLCDGRPLGVKMVLFFFYCINFLFELACFTGPFNCPLNYWTIKI